MEATGVAEVGGPLLAGGEAWLLLSFLSPTRHLEPPQGCLPTGFPRRLVLPLAAGDQKPLLQNKTQDSVITVQSKTLVFSLLEN